MVHGEFFIRIDLEQIHYPDFCPVCQRPATDKAVIAAISQKDKNEARKQKTWALGVAWPLLHLYKPFLLAEHVSVRQIEIPVCKDHAVSSIDVGNTEKIFTILGGFSVLALIVLPVLIVLRLREGYPVAPYWWFILLIDGLFMLYSLRALRPSKLNRAFSVVDVSPEGIQLLLKIENREYLDELVRLNPMASKVLDQQCVL